MFLQGVATLLGALVLIPFGSVGSLLERSRSWDGFDAEGANLLVVHAQKWDSGFIGKDCRNRLATLVEQKPGSLIEFAADGKIKVTSWSQGLRLNWAPWSAEELSGIQSCEEEPCNIKLGPEEVRQMKQSSGQTRIHTYLDLVARRAETYLKTSERREYEFPGKIVDPWSYFEAHGFRMNMPRPAKGSIWMRKLELAPGQAKALRQIVDRRAAVSADGSRAVIWLRDAYTDHYFDSWGEWTAIECQDQGAWVVQALFMELDLLKKTDFFSKLMQGKMRSEAEERGTRFLKQALKQLTKN